MALDQNFANSLIEAVNKNQYNQPTDKRLWVETSDRISFHAKGIRPKFYQTRKSEKKEHISQFEGWVTPANYESKYQYLIDNFILNRHPNENIDHYNWRLSTFPLIAQEIYLNAKQQILGAIFQSSHYEIKSLDNEVQSYLDNELCFEKWFKDELPEYVFTDPFGVLVVKEGHTGEFGVNERAMPVPEWVHSCNILSYQRGVFLLYCGSSIGGKKVRIYLDKNVCVKMIEGAEKDKYELLAYYPHEMGVLPVIDNGKSFFQPYVSWADLICRNVSDDEVIAKNASYPIREIVSPKCTNCMGACRVPNPDENIEGEVMCPVCKGEGVQSFNPGDTFYTPEKEANDSTPVQDKVKFYNPSIEINKFSFDRWKEFREFGMHSMHMRFIQQAQSGEAKAYDYSQLYILISNISNKLFEMGESCLKYITAYMMLKQAKDVNNYVIDKPQQFQIKSEYDIQEEYTKLLTSGADLTVRRAKLDEYFAKIYYGNNLALKKYDIIKLWDWLYGMNDNELATRKIIGSAQSIDFVRHDRADNLISNLVFTKGEQWFMDTDSTKIIAELETLLIPLVPDTTGLTNVQLPK